MAHSASPDEAVAAQVIRFCRNRGVATRTRFTVADNLVEAVRIVTLKGPDPRWRTINTRGDADDAATTAPVEGTQVDRRLLELVVRMEVAGPAPWGLRHTVVSAAHFARFSTAIRIARSLGLGWLVPARGELLIVPRPTLRVAEGQPDTLHDDTGRFAAEWPDGTGLHFLRGAHFSAPLYRRIIDRALTLSAVAALPDADQRSVALTYLTFPQLAGRSGAVLVDHGVRGTRLYRLPLPASIASSRPRGYGPFDYFIHMHDASHPEREFIEWVDPLIGQLGDAELCQAHAFGVTLQQWLSIEQEG